MSSESRKLKLPPRLRTAQGAVRRLGIELELIGVDMDTLSSVVAEHVGAAVDKISPYEHRVHGAEHGDWQVELDFLYLKRKGRERGSEPGLLPELDSAVENLLRTGAEQIVPKEVVSPPLPMTELQSIDLLVQRLRRAGARGTTDGVLYAFGMQLNPEVPALDAGTTTAYLKAFLCLYDWLLERSRVDLTRRITPYIDPFPRAYLRRVVDPDYAPALEQLMDDYLEANPTRNRALDLLPLFLHLDEARVRAQVADPLLKARPALHYRLPNCEIDRPEWGVHLAWNDWLQVEHLAGDAERLAAVSAELHEYLGKPFSGLLEPWIERVRPWLISPADL